MHIDNRVRNTVQCQGPVAHASGHTKAKTPYRELIGVCSVLPHRWREVFDEYILYKVSWPRGWSRLRKTGLVKS